MYSHTTLFKYNLSLIDSTENITTNHPVYSYTFFNNKLQYFVKQFKKNNNTCLQVRHVRLLIVALLLKNIHKVREYY